MLSTTPLSPLPEAQHRVLPLDANRRADPAAWPFGELTQDQRLNKAKQEARMRAGALRGLPSCFGDLA